MDHIVKSLTTEVNLWYLDDATLCDTPTKVLSNLKWAIEELKGIGLELNSSKCEIILINQTNLECAATTQTLFQEQLPYIKTITVCDSSILGSPIASQGVKRAIMSRSEALERMTAKLCKIDPHQALTLLKNCFSLPKLLYTLRSSPAYQEEESLASFDAIVKDSVSSLTNVDFDFNSWNQATLPIGLGGIGILSAQDVALPGFISSQISVASLVEAVLSPVRGLAETSDSAELIAAWKIKCEPGVEEPENAARFKQKSWFIPLMKKKYNLLLNQADQYSRARLLAAHQPGSGAWLSAVPVPFLGTSMDPESLRISIALRVGAPVCEEHQCRCGKRADSRGYHLLSCRLNAGRFPRHASLNDVVWRALRTAGIPSVLEPVGLDRGDGRRPDGISIFPFRNGKCLCWDATCVNTYTEAGVYKSAVVPSSVAAEAENLKRHKYQSLTDRFLFEPLAIETSGVFGPSSCNFIREIGARLRQSTGDPREGFWFRQRLAMAVQRGNAWSIIAAVRAKFQCDT